MTHKKTQTTKIHAQTRPPTQHGTNHQRSALTTLTGNHTTNTPTRKNSHQSIHREPNTQFSIFILDTLLDTQPPHPHPNNQPEKPVNHQKERKPTLPQKTPNHKPTRPATRNQPEQHQPPITTNQPHPNKHDQKPHPSEPQPVPATNENNTHPHPPNTNHNPMTPITHPQNPPTTPKTGTHKRRTTKEFHTHRLVTSTHTHHHPPPQETQLTTQHPQPPPQKTHPPTRPPTPRPPTSTQTATAGQLHEDVTQQVKTTSAHDKQEEPAYTTRMGVVHMNYTPSSEQIGSLALPTPAPSDNNRGPARITLAGPLCHYSSLHMTNHARSTRPHAPRRGSSSLYAEERSRREVRHWLQVRVPPRPPLHY